MKMRIMIRHSDIELAYLKVVTYTGLAFLKLIVGATKRKLIIVSPLTELDHIHLINTQFGTSLNRYKCLGCREG